MDMLVFLVGLAIVASALWVARVAYGHYALDDHPARFARMAGIVGMPVGRLRDSAVGLHLPTAERLCLVCRHTEECDAWMAAGANPSEAPEFCPNAGYLQLARRPLDTLD